LNVFFASHLHFRSVPPFPRHLLDPYTCHRFGVTPVSRHPRKNQLPRLNVCLLRHISKEQGTAPAALATAAVAPAWPHAQSSASSSASSSSPRPSITAPPRVSATESGGGKALNYRLPAPVIWPGPAWQTAVAHQRSKGTPRRAAQDQTPPTTPMCPSATQITNMQTMRQRTRTSIGSWTLDPEATAGILPPDRVRPNIPRCVSAVN